MKEIKKQSLLEKFWKDKEGHLAIWQFPNWPITFWAFFMLTAMYTHGNTESALTFAAFVSLIIWSLLEIAQGSSYFRRLLGAIVFIAAVFNRFS